MTPRDAVAGHPPASRPPAEPMPVSVQILSTLLFGGFAIVAVAIAFAHFWPAGLVLAVILGWRGGFAPGGHRGGEPRTETLVGSLCTLGSEARRRGSGNASFDAYRNDVLNRLEDERESFERFLDRLRAAKDQSEFDRFMDARVRKPGPPMAPSGSPAEA